MRWECCKSNPDWTEEETVLALDVYLSSGRKSLNKNDRRILGLFALLQRIPWPEGTTKNDRFRNNEGVTMKLSNLRSVDLGHCLRNTIMDRGRGKYGDKPDEVSRLAAEIRAEVEGDHVQLAAEVQADDEDTSKVAVANQSDLVKIVKSLSALAAKSLGGKERKGE